MHLVRWRYVQPQVVVPWKMTVVSSANLDRSRVVPEGTATLLRTIVAQAVADFEAEAAPVEPENVQLVARFATAGFGTGVTRGSVAGAAAADAASDAIRMLRVKATMAKTA